MALNSGNMGFKGKIACTQGVIITVTIGSALQRYK
jgi:hypothetical protein